LILVDTSVWIDFFLGRTEQVEKLEFLIRESNQVCICGIILQEVFQGVKDKKDYVKVKERLTKLPFIKTDKNTYILAAEIYRDLRAKGITIPILDTTIAATAIQNKTPLFTTDQHFYLVSQHRKLTLYD